MMKSRVKGLPRNKVAGIDQNKPFNEHKTRAKYLEINAKSVIAKYDNKRIPKSECGDFVNWDLENLIKELTRAEKRILQISAVIGYKSEELALLQAIEQEKEKAAELKRKRENPSHIIRSVVSPTAKSKKSNPNKPLQLIPSFTKLSGDELLAKLLADGTISPSDIRKA